MQQEPPTTHAARRLRQEEVTMVMELVSRGSAFLINFHFGRHQVDPQFQLVVKLLPADFKQ